MQNYDSTLSSYISLLAKQIDQTSVFQSQTRSWLESSTAADLFFEDAAARIATEADRMPHTLSNVQKVFVAVNEIASSSKIYIEKLAALSVALRELLAVLGVRN